MKALLRRIDPRRSLAAAVGWLLVALAMCLALAANLWLSSFVRSTLLEQYARRLEAAGEHVSAELDTALLLRLQSVSVVATMLSEDVQRSDRENLKRSLQAVRRGVPDLIWLAVTDADGFIVGATDENVVGQNVFQHAWMSQGLDVAWIEEGRSPREHFLKLTAPMTNADGAIVGVVAAQLEWRWVQALVSSMRASPGEWLLIDRDGIVREGPRALVGKRWRDVGEPLAPFDRRVANLGNDGSDLPARIQLRRLQGGGPHLIATPPQAPDGTLRRLGWQVVVVQPVESVAAFATAIEWRIALMLSVLGLVAAISGVAVARRLTRRVSVIAQSADAVLAGSASRIEVPTGSDEAARLGTALDRLLANLQDERDELRRLNAALDERVRARTEEISRLAKESRDAAVVRERLRMARDLHDTLAHSMMAMLTEIRVLKRIAVSRPEALSDELLRAEQAAREGLSEARLAIEALRSNPVRDLGLGAALAELAKAMSERSGIALDCHLDPRLSGLAAEPAETVYRMCEEMLRNVERHAGAQLLRMRLGRCADGSVELEIADDGVGFETGADATGHYGLVGLAEQAEAIGADLEISSTPGTGTSIRLRWARHEIAAAH
ncbi:histidine kinase [Variovorax sp. OV329]|uniref:sensor histidine kinase n=1 Tax=Variovorax sp. OV329 TaxID=1882825 RepID=UPI0008E17E49|nr:histidine kinase [Variovorax sp. OV329]SFN21739.1 Signal transduction histidine kinase [Variovorax sp. OV329]